MVCLNRSKVISFLLALACACGFWSISSFAITLDELDAILAQAPDLQTFLDNEDLVQKYFEGLQDYYGKEKFHRESFNGILKQLKKIIKKDPEFAKRLWAQRDAEKIIVVKSEIPSTGLKIVENKWKDYFQSWFSDLDHGSKGMDLEKAKAKIVELRDKIKNFRNQLGSDLTRKAREQKEIEFFATLASDPESRSLMNYLVKESINGSIEDTLRTTEDADVVFATLNDFKNEKLGRTLTELQVPSELYSKIRSRIPDKKYLEKESGIFEREQYLTHSGKVVELGSNSSSEYRFLPLSRRLHGIWKGIPLGECVGGNVKWLGYESPLRWGVVALDSVEHFNVEKNGHYIGFSQKLLMTDGTKNVGALEFGSPAFRNSVYYRDPISGELRQQNLGEAWAYAIKDVKYVPALSQTTAIDNAGTLGTVRSTAAFFFGETLGPTSKFEFTDSYYKTLLKYRSGNSYENRYSKGRLITAPTIYDSKELKTFNFEASQNPIWTDDIAISFLFDSGAAQSNSRLYRQAQDYIKANWSDELKTKIKKVVTESLTRLDRKCQRLIDLDFADRIPEVFEESIQKGDYTFAGKWLKKFKAQMPHEEFISKLGALVRKSPYGFANGSYFFPSDVNENFSDTLDYWSKHATGHGVREIIRYFYNSPESAPHQSQLYQFLLRLDKSDLFQIRILAESEKNWKMEEFEKAREIVSEKNLFRRQRLLYRAIADGKKYPPREMPRFITKCIIEALSF